MNRGAPSELSHLRDYAKKVSIPNKYTKINGWGQPAGLDLDKVRNITSVYPLMTINLVI